MRIDTPGLETSREIKLGQGRKVLSHHEEFSIQTKAKRQKTGLVRKI